MAYIEIKFELRPLILAREVLYADLSLAGYESFEETDTGLNAYIDEEAFDEKEISNFNVYNVPEIELSYSFHKIEDQNWNAVWESNFEPIHVNNNCVIRAPFHEIFNKEYEVIIAPQMSFGTGHHQTTFLMAQELFDLDLKGKTLMDMGCGTGVLAILASKLGVQKAFGIDIESWAYENALENCKLNNAQDIIVEKGDAQLLSGRSFDVILANINKNILLNDLPSYAKAIVDKGYLLLSGFFETDVSDLVTAASENGFEYISHKTKDEWAMIILRKK